MKQAGKYILTFCVTAMILTFWLVTATMIPRSSIYSNIQKSASFLTRDPEIFHYQLSGIPVSIRDQCADANSLNMAYYMDSSRPFDSVIWDYYYWNPEKTANICFQEAVSQNLPANTQYLRYWHGSQAITRPLLVFLDIRQIYNFHSIVIVILLFLFGIVLYHYRLTREMAGMAIAMAAVNIWFVPLCMEYTWMFLVMLIASVIAVRMSVAGKMESMGYLFLITGMTAAFLDFLTTETITVLIPVLLVLSIMRSRGMQKGLWSFALKNLTLWGIGFIGMWAAKWGIAALYIGENTIPYIRNNVYLHLGLNNSRTRNELALEGIKRNVMSLAPLAYGRAGRIVFFIFIVGIALAAVIYEMRNRGVPRQKINWSWIGLCFFLLIIPYVRYIALAFHSWWHYFFTHRAQAASVLALWFIVLELRTGRRPLREKAE